MGNSGWNRPAANQPTVKKGGAKAPSKVKGIVAGLVTVCALGGLCLWMFSGGEAAPKAKVEKENGRIKEQKSAKAKASSSAVANVPVKEQVESSQVVTKSKQDIDQAGQPEPEKETEAQRMAKRSYLKSQFEIYLHMAIPKTPGEDHPPAPLPPTEEGMSVEDFKLYESDIVQGLDNILEAEEGDSEATLSRKADIAKAKQDFLKCYEAGMSLRDFITKIQEKNALDVEFKREAQAIVSAEYSNRQTSDEEYLKVKEHVDGLLGQRRIAPTVDEPLDE